MSGSVLIVGAGPTGLNLAVSLAKHGVPFRIISSAAGPGEHSRAMVVQARTLEFYDQLGFAQQIVKSGVIADAVHLREARKDGSAKEVATIHFRELGAGISPYPFALAYPQDDHERFLTDKLKGLGVDVEWESELTHFSQDENGIKATVLRRREMEVIAAEYICGCDGAHSRVRETLGIGFPGGTYEQLFYVADVKIDRGFDRNLQFVLGEKILALMFPVRSTGMQRLIGLVPPELSKRDDLKFDDIRRQVERLIGVHVTELNWFSAYRVHHRVAERFRAEHAFLLGDAAHIHSPVGGQGMNTGIGDAVNLGWKLAQVIQERAASSLLDTYEVERIGFARSLIATTDRAFTPIVAEGISGELVRRLLAPLVFSIAVRFKATRDAIFRLVSQTRIHYPDSPLSDGKAGHVHGGDRLPWTGANSAGSNFAPLKSLDWQLHVYGDIREDLEIFSVESGLAVHVFEWNEGAAAAGFGKNSGYLVRPDGYVSLALPSQDAAAIREFIARFGIRFATQNQ